LRYVFLMEPVRVHLRVLGGNPLQGSDALWFTDGDCPWNLSLGQLTGDRKFDGETFLGRLWMLFLGRAGERKRNSRVRTAEAFSQDDACSKQPCLCYILYVDQCGFLCNMSSGHREGGPRSSMPWVDTCVVQTSTTRRPVPHIEEVK
jgi:hypothetical protein